MNSVLTKMLTKYDELTTTLSQATVCPEAFDKQPGWDIVRTGMACYCCETKGFHVSVSAERVGFIKAKED